MSDNLINKNVESEDGHEPVNQEMQDPNYRQSKEKTFFFTATDCDDSSLSASLVLMSEESKAYQLMTRV